MLSLSFLTPLLIGFDCEIGLMGFDCFVVVLRWVFVVVRSDLWVGGAMVLWGDGVVDSWWGDVRCGFAVVRSNLWAGGATVLWFVVG